MQMNWRKSLTALVLVGSIFPLASQAGPLADLDDLMGCHTRPLSDFLDEQGTTTQFFPPVADYVGWFDADFVNFALVDYAGLANDALNLSLGTSVSGTVLECSRDGGRAEISVVLSTRKALGFAQSIAAITNNGFDFASTPTIFGNKAVDVAAGAPPAVGPATLRTTFFIDKPGDPLPDLTVLVNGNTYAPWTLDFRSTTVGTHATKARLKVQQVGACVGACVDSQELISFSREIVDLNKE
jgi:hypothetical protein